MGILRRTSHVVPLADLTQEARCQVIEQARQLAIRGSQLDPNLVDHDIALRPLNGLDLGLGTRGWNETVSATAGAGIATYEASAINVGANNAARAERFIVVYGVHVASSVDSIGSIRWVIGGARTHEWDLQAILADEPFRQPRADRTMFVYPTPGDWIVDEV